MKCELISVGTELLTGDTLNTNTQFLSKSLSENGFSVLYHTILGDNPERLESLIKTAIGRSDIIITTGGLGPTQDDLTKETIAKALGLKMALNQEVVEKIKKFFNHRKLEMTDNNLRQAYIPEGSKRLLNPIGTAPGIMINYHSTILFLLPGPPHEMEKMYFDHVLPELKKINNQTVLSRYFHLTDIGESMAETEILDLIDHQNNPTLATYAKPGEVLLRLTANGKNEEEVNALLDQFGPIIEKRFADKIFSHSPESLETVIAKTLIKQKLTIATAESCTAGKIAATLGEIPGISAVLKMGLVTYSNEAKMQLLKVKKETLDQYGAVSEETAREMCENLYKISRCNLNVSVTGIAGPDGGTKAKPVGLVYMGLCYKGKTNIEKMYFTGDRKTIQAGIVHYVFRMIRKIIVKK